MSRRTLGAALTKNLAHLPDFAAVLIALAVLIASAFGVVDNMGLIQATCGALALLAISLLIIRMNLGERIVSDLQLLSDSAGERGSLARKIDSQHDAEQATLDRIDRFLNEGELRATTEEAVTNANQSLREFHRAGLQSAYPSLRDADLVSELRNATRSIRIISTWTGCLTSISEVLADKAQSGCDVKVLVMRHNSEFARMRSLELDPSDELGAPRHIAEDIRDFDRLFRRYPEIKPLLRVKAFDARAPMSMFAYDDTRLLAFYWPGLHAMDSPAFQVVATGGPEKGLATVADEEFERLWKDERTLHIRVVGGEPQYVQRPDLAWAGDDAETTSVLEELKRAANDHSKHARVAARKRVLVDLSQDQQRATTAVQELHERMIIDDLDGANMLVRAIEDAGQIAVAERVLREAIDSGFMTDPAPLVRHMLKTGRPMEAEEYLRKGVAVGNYYAIFRLVQILHSKDRRDQVVEVLRTGAEAGSRDAMLNLVSELDHSNRELDADRFLETLDAQGRREAGHQIAIREYRRGQRDKALKRLRNWADEGDTEAANILAGLTRQHDQD